MMINYTKGTDADFVALSNKLDDHLNELAEGEENRAEYVALNTLDDIQAVWIAYEDTKPVGCASFKKIEEGVAEVKRVFVCPEFRKQKIAERLMAELEKEARHQGFQRLVLETNRPFNSAISLYQKLGFQVIDNYGPYVGMPVSICLGKNL